MNPTEFVKKDQENSSNDVESKSQKHYFSRMLTWFCSLILFIDGPEDYRKFNSPFKSVNMLVWIVFVIAGIFIPLSYFGMTASHYDPKFVWCFVSYLLLTILMFINEVIIIFTESTSYDHLRNIVKTFESVIDGPYLVGTSILNGLFLFFRMLGGTCLHNNALEKYCCNPTLGSLPETHTILMMIIPFTSVVIFRSTRWSIQLFAWIVIIFFLSISTSWLSDEYSTTWVSVAGYVIFGGIVIYDARRQSFYTYKLYVLLQASTAELASLKECEYAAEMRHLIGNVAHDLKTPVTAFVSGIEHMHSVIEAMMELLPIIDEKASLNIPSISPDIPLPTMLSYIQELFKILKEISDTNQFLTISINRCIDHSKVTNDVALLASNTSFNLVETVNFPVNCIKRMQNAVTILVNISYEVQGKSIISDKLWFTENIFCLLSNAVRYSEGGIAELYVIKVDKDNLSRSNLHNAIHRQLPTNNQEPFLLIEFIDSGKGLDDDQIPTLFAPFKQAQRRAGGTGLGLFALASRMLALGGYYGFRHRQDNPGSIFWFAIPYKEDDTLSNEEGEIHESEQGMDQVVLSSRNEEMLLMVNSPNIPTISTPLSILLVEDALPMQKVLSRILQRNGYQVHLVDNGLKAIRVLNIIPLTSSSTSSSLSSYPSSLSAVQENNPSVTPNKSYDVVLMDLQMPVMDGFEAIRNIRNHEASHQLPHQFILAMSANSDEWTVNDALKEGADSFLPKPFHFDSFNKLVSEYRKQLDS